MERIGKLPIIKITRQFGDLPFIDYFKAMVFGRIARWFELRSEGIRYGIRVTEGMEKNVIWRKRDDGMYEPYDTMADMSMPYWAMKKPPTKKVVKNHAVMEAKHQPKYERMTE